MAKNPAPWREVWQSGLHMAVHSFGGPIAQIGVMHEEAVVRRQWVDDATFARMLAFAQLLPGPEALELCIHLGWLQRGVPGGVLLGTLFVLPGALALTLLALAYQHWQSLPAVTAILDGVRPVAVALIAHAAWKLGSRSLETWRKMAIGLLALTAGLLGMPLLALVAGGAVLGALVLRQQQTKLPQLRWILAIVLVLAPILAWQTPQVQKSQLDKHQVEAAPLVQLAEVHVATALVTFGGAYTALPYLRQQYVSEHHWLNDAQVVDALALGETTPGPLLCVGVFLATLAAGIPGALVGTFALFLPSFLLVLGLARHVDRLGQIPGLQATLGGIAAATVGLILALAAQLAPRALISPFACILALLAFALHVRWKWQAAPLVLLGALLGLLQGHWGR